MAEDTTINRYEPCPECSDGSCKKCGPASGEHAAPGVRLISRRIRFVRCPGMCKGKGCSACGRGIHPLCAPGVTIQTVDERATKRWVPATHLRAGGKALCGASVPDDRLVSKLNGDVANPCERCKTMEKAQ